LGGREQLGGVCLWNILWPTSQPPLWITLRSGAEKARRRSRPSLLVWLQAESLEGRGWALVVDGPALTGQHHPPQNPDPRNARTRMHSPAHAHSYSRTATRTCVRTNVPKVAPRPSRWRGGGVNPLVEFLLGLYHRFPNGSYLQNQTNGVSILESAPPSLSLKPFGVVAVQAFWATPSRRRCFSSLPVAAALFLPAAYHR
jgi:hypothetical protein